MSELGYKGFDENLQCIDFQYKVGGEYETNTAILCEVGFHFCKNPLDVFHYYPPASSRYCIIEADEVSDEISDDSKRCAKKIKIIKEIGLNGLISEAVKYILAKETNTENYSAATNTEDDSAATSTGNRSAATNTGEFSVAANTGDFSAATNTGNRSAATNTGDFSAATNTGYRSAAINRGSRSAAANTGDFSAATNTGNYSAAINTGYNGRATVEGENSIACALGARSQARATLGSWICIAEITDDGETVTVKTARVDGKIIKANTFYRLDKGEFMECN